MGKSFEALDWILSFANLFFFLQVLSRLLVRFLDLLVPSLALVFRKRTVVLQEQVLAAGPEVIEKPEVMNTDIPTAGRGAEVPFPVIYSSAEAVCPSANLNAAVYARIAEVRCARARPSGRSARRGWQ